MTDPLIATLKVDKLHLLRALCASKDQSERQSVWSFERQEKKTKEGLSRVTECGRERGKCKQWGHRPRFNLTHFWSAPIVRERRPAPPPCATGSRLCCANRLWESEPKWNMFPVMRSGWTVYWGLNVTRFWSCYANSIEAVRVLDMRWYFWKSMPYWKQSTV